MLLLGLAAAPVCVLKVATDLQQLPSETPHLLGTVWVGLGKGQITSLGPRR